jgi:hypothetical protein
MEAIPDHIDVVFCKTDTNGNDHKVPGRLKVTSYPSSIHKLGLCSTWPTITVTITVLRCSALLGRLSHGAINT